jgi:hypothetical protein
MPDPISPSHSVALPLGPGQYMARTGRVHISYLSCTRGVLAYPRKRPFPEVFDLSHRQRLLPCLIPGPGARGPALRMPIRLVVQSPRPCNRAARCPTSLCAETWQIKRGVARGRQQSDCCLRSPAALSRPRLFVRTGFLWREAYDVAALTQRFGVSWPTRNGQLPMDYQLRVSWSPVSERVKSTKRARGFGGWLVNSCLMRAAAVSSLPKRRR